MVIYDFYHSQHLQLFGFMTYHYKEFIMLTFTKVSHQNYIHLKKNQFINHELLQVPSIDKYQFYFSFVFYYFYVLIIQNHIILLYNLMQLIHLNFLNHDVTYFSYYVNIPFLEQYHLLFIIVVIL